MPRVCLAFLTAVIGSALSAQERPVAPPDSSPTANLQVQKIGPNDLISLAVYDCPELSRDLSHSCHGPAASTDAESDHQSRRTSS